VLDDWVTKNNAPDILTQVAQTPSAPFATVSSRPMCRYPGYPHYRGGPAKEASSFTCTNPNPAPPVRAAKLGARN